MSPIGRRRFLGVSARLLAAVSAGVALPPKLLRRGGAAPGGRSLPREPAETAPEALGAAAVRRPVLVSGSVTGSKLQYPVQTDPGVTAHVSAVQSQKRNNLFTRGVDQVELEAYNPNGGAFARPRAYEVLDAYGQVLRAGTVTGQWIRLGPASAWPLGWYRLRLVGPVVDPIFGNAYGAATFGVVAASAGLPAVPGWNQPASAVDVLGDGQDFVMRALVDAGCARLSIQDASQPTEEAEGFLRNVAFDRAWWLDPARADPARPHEHFVSFPNGTSTAAQLAGVTETVRRMYPAVRWFEGPSNEPDNTISPEETASQMNAFAAAVKAGNPAAQVLGPCLVTVNDSATAYWDAFFASGGGRRLDGVSTHLYNCVNGDPWLGDATMGSWASLLERHGVGHLPRWNTETGDLVTDYGCYRARRQLRWSIVRLLQQERWGIPKERSYYFYDASHGYWSFPSFLEGQETGQAAQHLQPITLAMRALSVALRGTAFSEELRFPASAAQLLRAYVFRGGGRTTVALFTAGTDALPVRLAVGATASATDVFGNPVALARSGSVVTVTASELPVYLELAGSPPVRPVDVGDGLMSAGANLARRAKPATNGSKAELDEVNSGQQYSSYLSNNDLGGPDSPWYDQTATFPALLSLSWPSPQTVRRAVIFFSPPWHQNSAPVRFTLQTLAADGSSWVSHYAYVNHSAVSEPFADVATGCTRETFYDECWAFNILLPAPVRTRAVRIDVAETTYGGTPDAASYTLCSQNQGGVARLCVRDFAVYAR